MNKFENQSISPSYHLARAGQNCFPILCRVQLDIYLFCAYLSCGQPQWPKTAACIYMSIWSGWGNRKIIFHRKGL